MQNEVLIIVLFRFVTCPITSSVITEHPVLLHVIEKKTNIPRDCFAVVSYRSDIRTYCYISP